MRGGQKTNDKMRRSDAAEQREMLDARGQKMEMHRRVQAMSLRDAQTVRRQLGSYQV